MLAILFVVTLMASQVWAAQHQPTQKAWMGQANQALMSAMSTLKAANGDAGLLVLTNAGFGQVDGASTEAFFDQAQQVTGCTLGKRSLLQVHKSINDPLWFSIFRKDNGQLVFVVWKGQHFEQQIINASPEMIFTPAGWKTAADGLIGPNAFSVISLSLSWAAEPPWPLVQAATFHDHFCPGVNAGYYFGLYAQQHLPLGPGDKYVFITAPAICPADALQMMFNTTAGKSSGYVKSIDAGSLQKYACNGVTPSTVVIRVNQKANSCQGMVLGMDWSKAYVDTGVKAEEIAAPGGPANPMFWISRAKMSQALARLPQDKLMSFVFELKQFSGESDLAEKLSGGDPYSIVFND